MVSKFEAPLLQLAEAAFVDTRGVRIVEDMRKKLAAAGFGVTVIGNGMTLRFSTSESKSLKCVSMTIIDITDDDVRDMDFMEDGQ